MPPRGGARNCWRDAAAARALARAFRRAPACAERDLRAGAGRAGGQERARARRRVGGRRVSSVSPRLGSRTEQRGNDGRAQRRPGSATPAGGAPGDQQGPHRRAAVESRHPRRHRLWPHAPLPQGVPLRSARHRGAALEVVADPQPDHPHRAAGSARAKTTPRSGTRERNEGPLKTITRAQAEKLGAAFADERVVIDWAMRYANPTTRSRLEQLQRQGCDRILVVPLYPQYAGATTATACDEAFRALMRMRWQPSVRVAPPYFDDPVYIDALADSIRAHLAGLDFEPEALIASFHGMPQRYLESGDPYHCHCQKTSRLLRERLGWAGERWHTTFQSRFGNEAWLQPYTIEEVARLARSGMKRLAIVAPGLLRRLPGDAGRARHREPRRVPRQWRREVHLRPLPQRQRAGPARHRARGAARADGLGVGPAIGCCNSGPGRSRHLPCGRIVCQ